MTTNKGPVDKKVPARPGTRPAVPKRPSGRHDSSYIAVRPRSRASARQVMQQRRRRNTYLGGGAVLAALAVAAVVIVVVLGSNGEVMPPGVGAGTPDVQPPALEVANTSGINGVVAYDTTGWPSASHNGPAARALAHGHVAGPVTYSVTPPVGGDHNGTWMTCGAYNQPVPNERAVHNLEHGAVWLTYRPSLPAAEVHKLRLFEARQTTIDGTGSRYFDLSPYPGLPAPIVISSWGFQLRVSSPGDPRLQSFVNKFRVSPVYTPEYGGSCKDLGAPLQT